MPDSPEHQPSAGQQFFGWLMIAAGAIIAFLSGTCTLVFASQIRWTDIVPAAIMILIVGGIPFVIGVALIFSGWVLVTPRKPSDKTGDGTDAG